jgi:type VI secretion system secreted protein VgrG
MAEHLYTLRLGGLAEHLQVLAFDGREGISQPYRFAVDVVSRNPDLDFEALLQQPAFLCLDLSTQRGIQGLVQRIEQTDGGEKLHRYRLDLGPQLLRLALRRNCRIFQKRAVPQILEILLDEHGIQGDARRFTLSSVYPAREYCVQYGESDLEFLQRLCGEEGLHYHFEYSADAHCLVFGDDQTSLPRLDQPIAFQPGSGQAGEVPTLQRFAVRLEARTEAVTRRDHDFQQPRLALESTACLDTSGVLEDYVFPGQFSDRARGRQLAQRALEAHRHDWMLAEGESDQPLLAGGHFLDVRKHPRSDWNQLWLLTEVCHEGRQPQVLEAYGEAGGETQGYRNRFKATPWDTPFRPPALARPRLLGTQSAVVCGPAGDEIHCDALGRIKVQFHWDREGQKDEHSSCWLRVASGWAGNQYGAQLLPRVGMTVLVSFLDGDPDQPLVTGCLYHAENPPPYALPEHKTRSVFRSQSTPDGEGFNELRIDDRKDAEQIYLHAQRDWEQHIGHDLQLQVDHEQHEHIGANRFLEVQGEEHHLAHQDRRTELKADDHLSVTGSQHMQLGEALLVEAGWEIHLSAGEKLVIDAGQELTLAAGGSWLKLDPSGVSLSGAQILLNSGGSPGKGSGAQVRMPLLASISGTGKPGQSLQASQPEIEAQEARWEEEEAESPEEETEAREEERQPEEALEQRITLRIGVFFDGTGNNTANSGLTEQCRRDDQTLLDPDTLLGTVDYCSRYGFGDPGGDGMFRRIPDNSYGNAHSNVAELFRLYQDDTNRALSSGESRACIKAYLEGIGTTSGDSDSLIGQGTGGGTTGVLARVQESPGKILEEIRNWRSSNPGLLIEAVEIDIFGFSRGAAAARHFANEVLKAEHGVLSGLLSPRTAGFAPNFSWNRVRLNFIGLFDTVAALVDPLEGDFSPANDRNPGLNLYLPPGCARKVVHLTARDEKRWNFALNSVAPGHLEIELPGSHSDIGGGYPPLMTERLLIGKPRPVLLYWGRSPEQSKAWQEALTEAEQLELQGLPAGSLRISSRPLSASHQRSTASSERHLVLLEVNRQVRNELARVYLDAMHRIAAAHGVPLDPFDPADPKLVIPADLELIAQKLLAIAHGASQQLSFMDERHLRARYIHLSAHWTPIKGLLINKPAPSGRLVYANQPQKDYPA